MNRILVPVDFSANTAISCQYALSVAKITGAEIILFHSFFDQIYFSDGGFSTSFESGIMLTDEIILDFYRQKEGKLREIAEELEADILKPGESAVNCTCRMESGDPEVQIMSAIDQFKPDLIIMGSGGMGKKGLLSGSVARRIIDHTNIPVIAVPGQDELVPVKNVVYMTAFDHADSNVIALIDSLLAPFRIKIYCLHILKNNSDAISKQKMKDLAGNPAVKNMGERVSFHVLTDNPEQESLRNFLEEHQIDLIAFIPHKRNIFKNIFYQGITKDDLFQTRIPILAIRESNMM